MREPFDFIEGSYNTHSVLCHYVANKQYSATNAWNVNNDGNVNNNNKYNSNYAVPVSDFSIIEKGELSFSSFLEAYYDCLSNKRNTDNAIHFQLDAIRNCMTLWKSVIRSKYKIGRSICFIVDRPVKREVFAASFRDRIIHHWIAKRVEPLFEEYLYPCMKSNRKGKGTLDAIREVYQNIYEESNGYTSEAWVYKFDLQGFFMSIDKRRLSQGMDDFLVEKYHEPDKELLRELTRKVILHSPQKYCLRKCSREKWEGLAPNKSLFNQDDDHGIAIGNLTSQMFANFFLRPVVKFCKDHGFPRITEYVDDFTIVHRNKAEIIAFIPLLRTFLWEELGIKLHPRKSYIQHYTKGLSFVGGIIKPHRIYMSARSVRRCRRKIWWVCRHEENLEKFRESVNSFLGLSQHYSEYKLRTWIMSEVFSNHRAKCYFTKDINSLKFCKSQNI